MLFFRVFLIFISRHGAARRAVTRKLYIPSNSLQTFAQRPHILGKSSALELTSVEDSRSFLNGNEVVVIGFYTDRDSKDAVTFTEIAKLVSHCAFAITFSEDVKIDLEVASNSIVLFKKFDEGRNQFKGPLSKKLLINFINTSTKPLIQEYRLSNAAMIFGGRNKQHILVFIKSTDPSYNSILSAFKAVAKDYRDHVVFLMVRTDFEDREDIIEFFGLTQAERTEVRASRIEPNGQMSKYKPAEWDLSEEGIGHFVREFLNKALQPYLNSQALPVDWDAGPVLDLVASNFKEVVSDRSKHVLVEFYSPSCGQCRLVAPVYQQLASTYQGCSNVVFARLDVSLNEMDEENYYDRLPTFKLFLAESSRKVVYRGERTLKDFTCFLDYYCQAHTNTEFSQDTSLSTNFDTESTT